jgi:hypothetical protein
VAEKAATFRLISLVRRGLGPRVIMGMAWSDSDIDHNLGLQARVMPACYNSQLLWPLLSLFVIHAASLPQRT